MPDTPTDTYLVVRNAEEQYSIWREVDPVPAGWFTQGLSGTREECLAHIEAIWTDIRPLSVRRRLAERRAEDKAEPE